MSDKIRMSDVFNLPLELRSDFVHFTKTDTAFFKVESVKSRDEELSVTHTLHEVINNYDALKDTITQLEADKAELVDFIKLLQLDVSSEVRAEELIKKLRGDE